MQTGAKLSIVFDRVLPPHRLSAETWTPMSAVQTVLGWQLPLAAFSNRPEADRRAKAVNSIREPS